MNLETTRKHDIIVVTDLDGTLLDHHSYSFAAAADAMARLRDLGIPLILNTSKTRSELLELRLVLDNQHPFIVENGSAVFVPKQYFPQPPENTEELSGMACRVFGGRYAQLLQQLQSLRQPYRCTGFSELSVAGLVALTGLDEHRARHALAREFSEPLLWQDSEAAMTAFCSEVATAGLSTLRGGRFLHVLGQTDKGRGMAWLRQLFFRQQRVGQQHPGQQTRQLCVIALGDTDNDIAMLQAADIGIAIRSPTHPPPVFNSAGRIIVSEREGPEGWSDTIHSLLDELI